jgi:hypothetical protein
MTLICNNIETISISNNFGGKLYALKVDINFNSATVFEASFVSENGVYSISPSSLNSESPSSLNIGGNTFRIYPVMYKITQTPSGKLLVVKFVDASHQYLDKYNITLDRMICGSRTIQIVPTKTSKENDVIGKYTLDKLASALSGFPITSRARNILRTDKIKIDSVGSVRDVLTSVGPIVGCTFYWDFTNTSFGGNGCIDILDETSVSSAESLASSIKNSNEKYISSYDESYSIEDNYTAADYVYKKDEDEKENTNVKFVKLSLLNILISNFWRKPTIDSSIRSFSVNELKTYDFFKLCVAAAIGKDFFNDYIYWNIAADGCKTFFNTSYISSVPLGYTSGFNNGQIGNTYNSLVINTLKGMYKAALIYYHQPGTTIKQMIDVHKPDITRAEIIQSLFKDKTNFSENKILEMANLGKGIWVMALDKEDKLLDSSIEILYNTCKTCSDYLGRYYISQKELDTNEYNLYAMSEENIYEDGFVGDSILSSLYQYYFNNALSPNQNPPNSAFKNWISKNLSEGLGEKKTLITLKFSTDNSAKSDFNTDENVTKKYNIYSYIDFRKNLTINGTEQLIFENINISNTEDSLILKRMADKKISVYAVSSNIDVEKKLMQSYSLFAKEKTELKRKYVRKESYQTFSFSDACISQSPSNSKSMSHVLNISECPQGITPKEWVQTLKSEKYSNIRQYANPSFTFSIERLVPIGYDWMRRGMEGYTLSIDGQGGVSTTITIGSRKKQSQILENEQRLINSHISKGLNFSKKTGIRINSSKNNVNLGLKAYS